MKRITRDQRLSAAEAAKYDALRKQIDLEKPQINSRIRGRLAKRRKAEAERAGVLTLGQKLRIAREARKQTQAQLAAMAGISQGYLSQLEQDEREPTLSIAARLACALGVSLDALAVGAA
ncbi:MAG: helix-turn-helix transcriptional regulator [Planctomycetia bacterium]|jgi:DNA-binding XRE family transcriptional regulator|nr:helix-turn-helix transcriptional regulator [Planctomycetia bacterium]